MSAAKNKRLRKQTFVFRKPLTNAPPASAGSGARQRVGMSGPAPLTKDSVCEADSRAQSAGNLSLRCNECPPASAGSGARQRVGMSGPTPLTNRRSNFMKILFASDIHGSAYYCRRLLDIYKETKASRMVILGDILYHGPRMIFQRSMLQRKSLPC